MLLLTILEAVSLILAAIVLQLLRQPLLNATGSNIIFNTGSLSASAIPLGGNVTITADPPPVAGGGVALVNTGTAVSSIL